MKISVIMSVYNSGKFLGKAIESILTQTHKDFEFIIVDDGSKDNSLSIITDYAKNDNRIKIIKNKKNLGLTKSLNKALKFSKGEFIARQDDDDIFMPSHLERHSMFLEENPCYAFCGCNGFQMQNNRDLVKYFKFNEIKKNLLSDNCFNHSGTVFRKAIFEKYGYYNEKYVYGQDYELFCRLVYKYQQRAANLDEKLIIRNMPYSRFLKKNIRKYVIQRFNAIRTKITYIKFSKYKLKCFISILINLAEILFLTHLMGKFADFLQKIKI